MTATPEELGFMDNDQERLQKEYARDRKDSDGGNDRWVFLLKKGKTKLRVLPAHVDSGGVYFKKVEEHPAYQDGFFNPVACPKAIKEACPYCEESDRLYEEGGEKNVAAAKELRPRQQFLFNIVVYSCEANSKISLENGVKILKTGVKVKRQLLDLDQDSAGGWGDITSLTNGHDININRIGSNRNDTEYLVKGIPTRTDVIAAFTEAGISIDKLKPVDLNTVVEMKSYEEIKEIMEENSDSQQRAPSTSAPKPAPQGDDIPF